MTFSAASKEYFDHEFSFRNATSVKFNLPNLYAGGHYVLLDQKDFGYSSMNNTIDNIEPKLTGIEPKEGSIEGGIFSLKANGMPYNPEIYNGNTIVKIIG